MCTGFVKKGKDIIYGYNLDLAIGAWDYQVYAKNDQFYIGIKVGSTVYRTHGINKNGNFANLPYMNGTFNNYKRGAKCQRIDLLVNDYIMGKLTFADVMEVLATKELVCIPKVSMHALIASGDGQIALLEPGYGYKVLKDNYAIITNFPLLVKKLDTNNHWYGKERYELGASLLANAPDDFSPNDALKLLEQLKQEGEWATRVSFVYSCSLQTVYYVLNNDFTNVFKHAFR